MKRYWVLLLTINLGFIFISTPAMASWQEGGNLVCGLANSQQNVDTLSDGQGNTYIVWEDYRSGVDQDIYFQKLDVQGNALWADGGVAVVSATGYQNSPRIFGDGADGCVVVWYESLVTPLFSVKAQHYDADGTPQWTTGGETIISRSSSYSGLEFASDGLGGVLVTWFDNSSGNYDIYAQRMDSGGNVKWTAGGVAVCSDSGNQQQPIVCPDGTGGAIIAWMDSRSLRWDVYVRRVADNGGLYWTNNGLLACNNTSDQVVESLVPDGFGGAIVSWRDYRSGSADVYGQKINQNGALLWGAAGLAICTATGSQDGSHLAPDGAGGAVFVWMDDRSSTADIYVQKASSSGSLAWTANGVQLSNEPTQEYSPCPLVVDGGSTVVVWRDSRGLNYGLYAQMVDPSGTLLWPATGTLVTDPALRAEEFGLTLDGEGGVILAWKSYDSGLTDIWSQRLERNGYWGYPAPNIAGVRDIPGDQGGAVDLAWDASRLDPYPDMAISRYTVWRAIEHDKAHTPGARVIQTPADLSVEDKQGGDVGRDVILSQEKTGAAYYWKLISTLDAYFLETYSEVAITLFDSTSVSAEDHFFQVIAHGATPDKFWISEPDSGHSVDNLAPDSPKAFTGAADYQPGGLQLAWDPNTEADLAEYALYRSTSAHFVPSPANLVTVVADTSFFDTGWTLGAGYHYKLAALDVHENSSGFTALDYADVSEAGDGALPAATRLAGNYPNPFNPATRIAFDLDRARVVNLRIYDLAGRLVKVLLAEEAMKGGHHGVVWNGRDAAGQQAASGVYFYSLEADEFRFTGRMVMVK